MHFTKRLRAGVMAGEITESIRIWQRPHVKVGGRYGFPGGGQIEVTRLREIEIADITPEMARPQGFDGLVDLLKIAKHGPGERVFLVEFAYHAA